MSDKIVVAATKKSNGQEGIEYPSRYVVLKWAKFVAGIYVTSQYSRHMQVFDGVHDDYFIYGHYYTYFDDALQDMVKSMEDNNRSYPLGNISHMPGTDFVDGSELPVSDKV
jgi:glycerol-3-phosphate cytidylyltransferase-like family protein